MSIKRYRYRAYPKPGQVEPIAQVFGCSRAIWNNMLKQNIDTYQATGAKLTPTQNRDAFNALKTEHPWLREVSSVPLQQSARDLEKAYKNFFSSITGKRRGAKMGAPRFKKRSNRQSARFTRAASFSVRQTSHGVGFVRLPKIGWVRFNLSRGLPSDPSSVTLIKEADGCYYVSFVVEEPQKVAPTPASEAAGVDVGLTDLAVVAQSNGARHKVGNPRHYRQAERKLARAQKKLSRKKPGSKRREKQRLAVAKIHSKVKNQRLDFAHKLSKKLVDENQVIALETLSVRGLARTRLAKSVYDAGWGQLMRLVEEKAAECGRLVVFTDRWAPTTQVCSVCGVRDGKKSLSVRVWECGHCEAVLDRDYNAAVNIMLAAGLAESLNGRGGDVRQALASAVPGEASTHRTV